MSIGSRILARLWHLPGPCTRDIVEHRDIRVSMSDGVALLANRYYSPARAMRETLAPVSRWPTP